jgi:hypothetical protein
MQNARTDPAASLNNASILFLPVFLDVCRLRFYRRLQGTRLVFSIVHYDRQSSTSLSDANSWTWPFAPGLSEICMPEAKNSPILHGQLCLNGESARGK